MRLIEASIRNPLAVGVAVLLVCLFGGISLSHLPLQLFPEMQRPNITIATNWRAASPEEVEGELLEPQEQVLQGLPGVEEIEGNANGGGSFINLTCLGELTVGHKIADAVVILGSFDIVMGEVDR